MTTILSPPQGFIDWPKKCTKVILKLVYVCVLYAQLCLSLMTLRTVARQAPLSMGFSRQEYWSGLSHPAPGDVPTPGIKPASLMSPALEGGFFTTAPCFEI